MSDTTEHKGGEDRHQTLYHVSWNPAERVYLLLVCTFVTLLVLTNIIGQKLFLIDLAFMEGWPLLGGLAASIGGTALTAGIITYPITFLVTDIVSEVWGKKRADRMVWMGFGMSLLMLIIVQISLYLTPHQFWDLSETHGLDSDGMQTAWSAVFGIGPWLVTGSMCAYLAAQLCDNFMFHFWRKLTKGKHLWLRNNGSTWLSQGVDTFIVNSFLFYGAFGWSFRQGIEVMAVIYVCKLLIAAADTPFCYWGIAIVRRHLHRSGSFERN